MVGNVAYHLMKLCVYVISINPLSVVLFQGYLMAFQCMGYIFSLYFWFTFLHFLALCYIYDKIPKIPKTVNQTHIIFACVYYDGIYYTMPLSYYHQEIISNVLVLFYLLRMELYDVRLLQVLRYLACCIPHILDVLL